MEPIDEMTAAFEAAKANSAAPVSTPDAPPDAPVVTTPPVSDAPAATPDATGDLPPADTDAPPAKNIMDVFTAITPVVEPDKPQAAELSEEIKQKILMADEYNKILQQAKDGNPLAMAMMAGESAEKLQELARLLIPEDHSHLSYEQLIRMDFERKGLSGEQLTEAIEHTMSEYKELPAWKKELQEKEMKSQFKSKVDVTPYMAHYQKQLEDQSKPVNQPTAEQIEQTKQADLTAISQVVDQLHDAEAFGYKFDKDIIGKDIIDGYNERDIQPYIKKDNTIDATRYVNDAIGKHWAKIAEAAYNKGVSDTKKASILPNGIKKTGDAPSKIIDAKGKAEQMAEFLNNSDNIK